jgi:hypothetical protein
LFLFSFAGKQNVKTSLDIYENLLYSREIVAMQPQGNWVAGFALRVVPLGVRSVRKPNGRVYRYLYLRLDSARFPEVLRAYKLRLVIVPPDLSAPPAVITARVFQRSRRTSGFDVEKRFQPLLEQYSRNGFVAIIASEVLEEDRAKFGQNNQTVGGGL